MRRILRWAIALAGLPLVGLVPAADATGAAACTITGTITFLHAGNPATQGTWTIDPAVINCQGLFNGYERIVGPGRFSGTGSYTALPGGSGSCLRNVGSGTVDYTFPTTGADVHLVEPNDYTLAGIGAFTTPSLRGTFEITPPYEGDCVTKPITKALFLAEAMLVRFVPPDPQRYFPPKR
ncbi:MAG: hypothetical protein AB1679_15045 [Actinomycetota bacterium]